MVPPSAPLGRVAWHLTSDSASRWGLKTIELGCGALLDADGPHSSLGFTGTLSKEDAKMKHNDTISARTGHGASDGGAGRLYMTHGTTFKRAYHFRPLLSYCLTVMLCLPSLGEAVVEGIPCTPEPTSMIVNYGDLVNCRIDPVGDGDVFRFSGAAGETIRVQTARIASVNLFAFPFFEVFGPDGTEVCSGFNRDCRLTQTGVHTILLSEDGNTSTVDYAVALERIAPPSAAARPIDYSQVLNDEINGVGDIDAFVFGGAADALVRAQSRNNLNNIL